MRNIVTVVFLTLATQAQSEGFFSWLFNSNKEIKAEIALVNKCELESRYFIVRDLETGKSAPFKNGIAKLKTKVRVVIAEMNSPLFLILLYHF